MCANTSLLMHTQPSDMWRYMKIHAKIHNQHSIQVNTRSLGHVQTHAYTLTPDTCQHMRVHAQLLIHIYTFRNIDAWRYTLSLSYMQTPCTSTKSPWNTPTHANTCPALDTCQQIMCWNMPWPQSMKIRTKPLIHASRAALDMNQYTQDLNKHTLLQTCSALDTGQHTPDVNKLTHLHMLSSWYRPTHEDTP